MLDYDPLRRHVQVSVFGVKESAPARTFASQEPTPTNTPTNTRTNVPDCCAQPLFVTVSGAHLYGFPSPDSDVDLRGCHQAALRDAVGLNSPDETISRTVFEDGLELDFVSHEVRKYFTLLLKNNGYILEQIFSPLVVMGDDFLSTLRPLASRCVTKFHYHHYRGFFASQKRLLDKQEIKTAKALLYAYRVLMTGVHLLRSGNVECNIGNLNREFGLPFIDEVIAEKNEEKKRLPTCDWEFHQQELGKLEHLLDRAFETSPLPETRDKHAINELLVALRLDGFSKQA